MQCCKSNESAAREVESAQIDVFPERFWPSVKVDKEFRYPLDLVYVIVLDRRNANKIVE
jgi:hypothetical protein